MTDRMNPELPTSSGLQAGDVFRQLADIFTFVGDDNFFDRLTQCIATILGVDYVLCARIEDFRQVSVPVSFYTPRGHQQAPHYVLAGTPCERVRGQDTCYFSEGVAAQFPSDTMLSDLGVDSYMGYAIMNRSGKKLGLICIMHSQTLENESIARDVLRMCGAQIGVEMQRQASLGQISQLAYQDVVTGLPNRAAFTEKLNNELYESMRSDEPLSLLVLDLRRFKEINDLHGHEVGDAVLALTAKRLKGFIENGEYLARYGSDEFGILMPGLGGSDLPLAIERVKSAFHEPIKVNSKLSVFVEVNVGAAQYPGESESGGTLFQHASIALEHAKRVSTRSRIYDASMGEFLQQKQSKIERLGQAIRNEGLALYYQPQFDLYTGELIGAEALCRWDDEVWGQVSPVEFIALAEERGLIRELGDWVVRNASAQLREWNKDKDRFTGVLSINVSAQQFDSPYLVDYFLNSTKDIPTERLGIEITESIMMRYPEQAMKLLARLRERGYSISIDDFGTGFSSLSYLSRFPLSALKIDRSFVSAITTDKHNMSIVSTIIAMAKNLKMNVVAEGVETEEQAELLRNLGCHSVQGYLYGKPVSAREFEQAWLS
ncbi:bifunctional diguanylate cyclase/phosphodiesterase [Aliidiomarina halalkaliphila]|uniref:Bifunctional diguanylate cyclase/phosphodiesterase n=1 Tax=Aliidiomarina halalkaliphila TaxID=2593535 RepID=A0A552X4I6_9GAMM|nr:bifunctional diguanylate cyclase/phosphodiesterase [Aliidiomarina halalkaliphila]TRW49940.1 bifunctional diguanylate cyclase/phosphodiesterase [Aliidiomarina halalkaliphila]